MINTGYKKNWQLVELGAGSGILMRDIIFTLKKFNVYLIIFSNKV